MGKAVEIIDEHGVSHVYPIRTAEELTVAEWVRMAVPPIQVGDDPAAELEGTYELLHRFLGCPMELLRRIPFSQLGALVQSVEAVASEVSTARKDGTVPASITFEGVTYTVPQNPAEDMTLGQYADIVARLDKVQYEDESLAVVLGVMLNPEGGYDAAGLEDRIAAFGRLPAIDAIRIAAFFFAGSEDLSAAWSRCMTRRLMSRLQQAQQGLTDLASVGASTPPSPEPLP